jgi:hypothetical protein
MMHLEELTATTFQRMVSGFGDLVFGNLKISGQNWGIKSVMSFQKAIQK